MVHWLLPWAFIAQAAMPLQAHTKLAASESGQVVVLCTWTGTRSVAFGEPEAPHGDSPERVSPACLFSQLLHSADVTAEDSPSAPVFVSVSIRPAEFVDRFPPEARRSHAIRGPPSRSVAS